MTPSYPDLAGKVALVTGGSKGIGAATCRMLARQGVAVVVNGRDPAPIADLVTEVTRAGGRAIGMAADCRDFKAIQTMRERVESEFGPADVLLAYAGGFGSYTPAPKSAKRNGTQWSTAT